MDFFGDYTIETASCHPSSLNVQEDDVFAPNTFPPPSPISPRDTTTTSYPSAIVNVTDLARQFTLQSLDKSDTSEAGLSSPTSSNYSTSSSQYLQVPSSPLRRTSISSPRTTPCWKRRMQRQRDMRLQADPTHLRSISELVGRMIDSDDQCVKRKETDLTPTPSTPLVEDEDFDSSDSGSPRSLSSSSSHGRRPSYFSADFVSPTQRRGAEPGTFTLAIRDAKIQKSRPRRGGRR